MQVLLTSLVILLAAFVVTDGQYYYGEEVTNYPVPVPVEYPYGYGGARAVYPNYMMDAPQTYNDAPATFHDEEYNVVVKPIELHISPYIRQGRGKKGGGGGKKGGGKSPGGGWWYYIDHKGCHSGTYGNGPPPPPGLEKEHYIQGACGKLGNHFKRVQGKKPGQKGWGKPHGGHGGWGPKHYGQGWGYGGGKQGGYGGGFLG